MNYPKTPEMKFRLTPVRFEYVVGASISVVTMVVYLVTLCPTVSFIDSGELGTDACTLGIAHPTGYPLFTLVGRLFSLLPLGLRAIRQLNVMGALFCSLGLFFFFRFLVFFLGSFRLGDEKNRVSGDGSLGERGLLDVYVPAAAASLLLGFSETYWSQALAIEVYSLHVLFLSILLFLFTKAIHSTSPKSDSATEHRDTVRSWYLYAFVLGLAFTNHMTTILLAPASLFLYFSMYRFSRESWIRVVRMSVPFLLGLSLYMYLPVRAGGHPLMNWGDPVDFDRFFTHFTGKVYRVWLFSSTEAAGRQFKYFLDTLPSEFVYFPFVFAVMGLWKLFRERRRIFFFTILLFVGCVLYSINYDIHDIDSYFLLAYITVAIWAAVGIRSIMMEMRHPAGTRIFVLAILCSCLVLVAYHYDDVDESATVMVEGYTKDMFQSVEPNGVILSYQWDYFVSAAYYFQLVEHVRTDIVVIDKELLRRSWYFKQLERRYPWLVAQSKQEIDAFLAELYKFEHDLPYNANVIEYRYAAMIRSFIEKNYASRPVYVTQELEIQYTSGFSRVPSGLAYRLFNGQEVRELPVPEYHIAKPQKRNKYVEGILSLYAESYANNAVYLHSAGKMGRVGEYVKKALEVDPTNKKAVLLKNEIGMN